MSDVKLLDHGYIRLVETWGSDERIIEAARMSVDKGFVGWGPFDACPECKAPLAREVEQWGAEYRCQVHGIVTPAADLVPGDEKLLRYLWEHKHATPFEMAGAIVEVQAPIFVFREWHRHRTQCLGPDTLVHFDAPKSKGNRRFVYKMRIEDIWKKWQPTKRTSRPERQTNSLFPRSRIQSMQIRSLDWVTNEFETTNIVDVIRGEPKPMVRVTVTSGRSFVATRDHQVYTADGWMTLGEAIDRSCTLALEGSSRGKAMSWEVPFSECGEKWRPVFGWEGLYEVSDQGRVRRNGCQPRKHVVGQHGYPVVGLNRPGLQITRTVHSIVLEAFVGPRQPGKEVRHLNSNRADARLSNLEWGTAEENARDRVDADRNQRLVPVFEEIVSVVDAGVLPSFDISVASPMHNFVADGFVVHNSYNELSARYTPLPDLNYIPTVERLMQGSDGKNKQAGTIKGAVPLTVENAERCRKALEKKYRDDQALYEVFLMAGVPKELARVHLPVARFSRMRASSVLRNWFGFLSLRMATNAQYEIRVYADVLFGLLAPIFPRSCALFAEGLLK